MMLFVLSDLVCMLSVGTICFEGRFCASRKGGTGEVGGCHPDGDSA